MITNDEASGLCACVRGGGEVAILPGIRKCELALSDQCAECCIVVSALLT